MKKIILFAFLLVFSGCFIYMFEGRKNNDFAPKFGSAKFEQSPKGRQEQEESRAEKKLESGVGQAKSGSIEFERNSEAGSNKSNEPLEVKSVENFTSLNNNSLKEGNNLNKDQLDRFSKIDGSGNLLSADATNWSCIFDSETQLVWEIKTLDSTAQSSNNRFSWFVPDTAVGVFSGATESENTCTFYDKADKLFCNTHNLMLVANKNSLCGFSGWRLPSIEELSSIIVNRGSASVIDTKFFPNTQPDYYWTSDAIAYEDRRAWAIKFSHRAPKNDLEKSSAVFARLVVGNP